MTTEQFVAVYVALRRAEAESATEADFEARRADILRDAGISGEDLMRFVDAHAADLGYMAGVWDTIQARLDRADTAGGV